MARGDCLIIQVAVAMIILSTLAIALRFWSRSLAAQHRRFGADDWLALGAWLLGLGPPVINLADSYQPSMTRILKMTFANDILFHLGVGISKLSALAFYHRVLAGAGMNKKFVIALKVTAGLVLVYILCAIPTIIWSCDPVDKFWYPSKEGHCIDYYGQSIFVSVFDTLLDLVILLLPMPLVSRLQMKMTRKLLVAAAFFAGYCALIVSIGHMITSIEFEKPGGNAFVYNGIQLAVWSELEVPIAVVSICLPNCFWLLKRLRAYGLPSLFTRRDFSSSPRSLPLQRQSSSPEGHRVPLRVGRKLPDEDLWECGSREDWV